MNDGSFGSRRGLVPTHGSRHKCIRAGCQVQVPYNLAACRRDWARLPKPMRDEVYDTWDGGRGAGSGKHTRALIEATQLLAQLDADEAPADRRPALLGEGC